jgi:hypothetical protein
VAGERLSQSDITGRYMASPGGFLADARRCDIMLDISGGDSFTDIYASKRFAYISSTKILTILAGTPLVLSPQTICPFSRQPHSAIAAWICRHASAVFVRDDLSLAAVAALAPGRHGAAGRRCRLRPAIHTGRAHGHGSAADRSQHIWAADERRLWRQQPIWSGL